MVLPELLERLEVEVMLDHQSKPLLFKAVVGMLDETNNLEKCIEYALPKQLVTARKESLLR